MFTGKIKYEHTHIVVMVPSCVRFASYYMKDKLIQIGLATYAIGIVAIVLISIIN